ISLSATSPAASSRPRTTGPSTRTSAKRSGSTWLAAMATSRAAAPGSTSTLPPKRLHSATASRSHGGRWTPSMKRTSAFSATPPTLITGSTSDAASVTSSCGRATNSSRTPIPRSCSTSLVSPRAGTFPAPMWLPKLCTRSRSRRSAHTRGWRPTTTSATCGDELAALITGRKDFLMGTVAFRKVDVDGIKVFYREAGPKDARTILLLHGFPSAGHMFRDLIPQLSERFRLVAPDLPGFGQSDMPARSAFTYTFESIANVIDRFTELLHLDRFAMYVFDYGAPVGFRLAARHPDRLTAIIPQNGNAYEEGLSDGWNPIRAYWQEPSPANREALRSFLAPETTRWQYTHGVPDVTAVSPDGYSLDNFYLGRGGADEIQLDLFGDYKSNVALYPTFQSYFRTRKPPFLAVWGKNDPFFLPPGAEAFKRDIPGTEVRFFDTGHFALETHCEEIATAIRAFLSR